MDTFWLLQNIHTKHLNLYSTCVPIHISKSNTKLSIYTKKNVPIIWGFKDKCQAKSFTKYNIHQRKLVTYVPQGERGWIRFDNRNDKDMSLFYDTVCINLIDNITEHEMFLNELLLSTHSRFCIVESVNENDKYLDITGYILDPIKSSKYNNLSLYKDDIITFLENNY